MAQIKEIGDDYFEHAQDYLGQTALVPVIGNHDANRDTEIPPPYPEKFNHYFSDLSKQ